MGAPAGIACVPGSSLDKFDSHMGKEFSTVALVGRSEDPRVAEPMTALANYLVNAGVSVIASPAAGLEPPVQTGEGVVVARGGTVTAVPVVVLRIPIPPLHSHSTTADPADPEPPP